MFGFGKDIRWPPPSGRIVQDCVDRGRICARLISKQVRRLDSRLHHRLGSNKKNNNTGNTEYQSERESSSTMFSLDLQVKWTLGLHNFTGSKPSTIWGTMVPIRVTQTGQSGEKAGDLEGCCQCSHGSFLVCCSGLLTLK